MNTLTLRTLAALALAASSFCAFGPSAGASPPDRAPYIVVLEDSVQHQTAVARSQLAGRNAILGFVYRHALSGYSARLPEGAVAALRHDPRIAYLEPDLVGGVAAQTTPTAITRNFVTKNPSIDIDGIDDLRVDADVAVIDSGVDHSHPDLSVVARTDCSNGPDEEVVPGEDITPVKCIDESGTDGDKHGTHVAGTIAAIDNNQGVVGVAPGARIWAVKVLDSSGWGTVSEYIAGIDWVTAHSHQIEVANSSLGYPATSSKAFSEAMQASVAAGIVHVAAAGNSKSPVSLIPGNDPNVITVSALADYDGLPNGWGSPTCWNYGGDDELASFSNYGTAVDIVAPGTCVLSTLPGNQYGLNSGTSMAAPQVAGAAAILASTANPESKADVEAVRQQIIAAGNYNWTDTSPDGVKEPLLDVRNDIVFGGSGPIAAYSFDEGTGTLLHDSAGNHDGTLLNGAGWSSEGKHGSALKLDGENDFVSIADAPDLDFTSSFTLEAWVRPEGTPAWDGLITKAENPGQSGSAGYMLDVAGATAGKPDAWVADGTTTKGVTAPSALSSGEWRHLAVTLKSNTLRLYRDGSLVAENTAAIPAKATTANLELGRVGGILSWYFKGLIDDVRLYGKALEPWQIEKDISAAVLAPAGIYLAGAISSEEAKQPRFEAVAYPSSLSGHQNSPGAIQFTISGTTFPCASATFSGTLTKATKEILLSPQFSGCTAAGYATTIIPNSCKLKGALANSGPPYTGSSSIACEGSDQIEFDLRDAKGTQVCLAKVPAQSLSGPVPFENQGPGRSRRVGATLAATGMKWTRSGTCLLDGKGKEGSNGQLGGGLSLGAAG